VSDGTTTKTITIGRIGIMLGPERLGPAAALVGGIAAVGHAVTYSFQEIGQVFGPQGIGKVWGSLVQGKPRDPTGPASIVGVGQQVGSVIEQGFWGDALYFLGFLTVFIGLINLIPLPPFDGGHLAVLAIEKIRGKAVDARKVVPVAVVVLGFFVVFVLATVLLDLTKPLPTP